MKWWGSVWVNAVGSLEGETLQWTKTYVDGRYKALVSRQYAEKEAAISYLERVVEKLHATREIRAEEPILYVKMQIAAFKLVMGNPKECKQLLEREN
ncbi:hypothetical protein HPP92_005122 [Vanilla planifolia]|uniref:PSD13 N-terminal domain-containing protein n=1 Tax=Vanilla planifolia TaxID=51239 RepID=A0A835RP42_VANPL|nr:hypothetical protein HPP92_005122 [Vanilla planifolia]